MIELFIDTSSSVLLHYHFRIKYGNIIGSVGDNSFMVMLVSLHL